MSLDVATVLCGTAAQITRLTGDGKLVAGELTPGDLQRAFSTVSIDSRTISPGSLFFALPGEHVDGNDYVGEALRSGALGCVLTRQPTPEMVSPALRNRKS